MRQYEIDGDKQILDQAEKIKKIELDLIKKSDVFLTFSQDEKDIIINKLPEQYVEVIPIFFYDKPVPPITDFRQRQGIIYVGGFKHKPNVDAVLWFARTLYPEIKKRCPGIVFYIAGNSPPSEITDLNDQENIRVLGYLTDKELTDLYNRVKMVVLPIRFGSGVKGKTVEAIHHSLPFVSTSIGSEGIDLENIVTPTDDPEEFVTSVIALYQDESALRECSMKLSEYALNNLTYASAKAKMVHILNTLK